MINDRTTLCHPRPYVDLAFPIIYNAYAPRKIHAHAGDMTIIGVKYPKMQVFCSKLLKKVRLFWGLGKSTVKLGKRIWGEKKEEENSE